MGASSTAEPGTARPVALVPDFDAIPAALRRLERWLVWRYTWKSQEHKWDKPPKVAGTGEAASSTDPLTWRSFVTARAAYAAGGWDGVGFVLQSKDGISGIDLDKCRDPQTDDWEPWASEILHDLDTYTEISPSGRGLRAFCFGFLPVGRRRAGRIEMYDDEHYLTVTGQRVLGTPATLQDRQETLAVLHARVFPRPEQRPGQTREPRPTGLDDDELVALACQADDAGKFEALWQGKWEAWGFPSQSEADLSLANKLAFWTGRDAAQVDRLFRRSGLYRAKWDNRHYGTGETFGERTIQAAIEFVSETYSPPPWRAYVPPQNGQAKGNGQVHADAPQEPIDQDDAEPESSTDSPRQRHPLTDYGNGERLVDQHGPDLRFVHLWQRWLVWDGRRFAEDDTAEIERRAKQTTRQLYAEAAATEDKDRRDALGKHALRTEAKARIDAMIAMAGSEASVSARPDQLDADPWLLNVHNGTLDLRTGLLLPHDRVQLITKLAGTRYAPDAACPVWDVFLERVLPSPEVRQFLQRAAGYSLTGLTTERILLLLYGRGRNGKGTFLETLGAAIGDYGIHTPATTLLAKRDTSVPNDLARLKSARFVWTNETDQNRRLAEALVKELTGDDTISARFMRAEWFDFKPAFQIWLATNSKPVVRGTDPAIWDRIRLVPFEVRIPEEEADRSLKDKLRAELPGILAWAVRGCLAWQRDGLGLPEAVKRATTGYRIEMDVLGQFLDERCIQDPEAKVSAKALYAEYQTWCKDGGEDAMTQTTLGIRLRERNLRGVVHKRREDGYWWLGIGLLATGQA